MEIYIFNRRTTPKLGMLACSLRHSGNNVDVRFSKFKDPENTLSTVFHLFNMVISLKTGKTMDYPGDTDADLSARKRAVKILFSHHPEVIDQKIWEF